MVALNIGFSPHDKIQSKSTMVSHWTRRQRLPAWSARRRRHHSHGLRPRRKWANGHHALPAPLLWIDAHSSKAVHPMAVARGGSEGRCGRGSTQRRGNPSRVWKEQRRRLRVGAARDGVAKGAHNGGASLAGFGRNKEGD